MAGVGLLFLVVIGALGQVSLAYLMPVTSQRNRGHSDQKDRHTMLCLPKYEIGTDITVAKIHSLVHCTGVHVSATDQGTTRDWRYQTTTYYPDTTRDWRYQTSTYYPYNRGSTRDWRYQDTTRDWRYQTSTYYPYNQGTTRDWRYQTTTYYPDTTRDWRYQTSTYYPYNRGSTRDWRYQDTTRDWRYQTSTYYPYNRGSTRDWRYQDTTRDWRYQTSTYYPYNQDAQCGGEYSATYVVLESPNYPQPYPRNSNCVYEVTSPVDLEMTVERVNLEYDYDFLEIIRDYGMDRMNLTGNRTYTFTWTSKHFRVLFRSDGSNEYPYGFRILFKPAVSLFPGPSTSGYYGGTTDYWRTTRGYNWGTTQPPATCGGTYRANEGVIESPNYPDRYPDNADCWYYIFTQGPGTYATIEMDGYDLESGYDYLSLLDDYGYEVWNVSGNSGNRLYQNGRHFRVHFQSDSSETRHGFRITWAPASDSTTRPSWWGYTTQGWWTTRSWWPYYTTDSSDRISVTCNAREMSAVVPIDVIHQVFPGVSPYDLTLNNPNCWGQVYSNVVIFRSGILGCDMIREETMYEVVYQNRIRHTFRTSTTSSYNYYGTTENSGGAAITRFDSPDIKIECSLDNYATAVGFYRPQNHEIIARGHGNLSVYMDLYRDSNYNYKITSYPITLALDQEIYVDLRLDAGDPGLKISPQNCFATPSYSPYTYYNNKHNLITDGCPVDPTVIMEYAPNQHIRFRFRSFEFLKDKDQVYIFCHVNLCNDTDYYRRCHHNCYGRHRRDTADVAGQEEHDLRIFQGPLTLRTIRSAEQEKKPDSALSRSIPAVVMAVAAVAMVIASVVMVITRRRSNRSGVNGEEIVI